LPSHQRGVASALMRAPRPPAGGGMTRSNSHLLKKKSPHLALGAGGACELPLPFPEWMAVSYGVPPSITAPASLLRLSCPILAPTFRPAAHAGALQPPTSACCRGLSAL
jgi:hypothetical protein